jgi:restriction system protein
MYNNKKKGSCSVELQHMDPSVKTERKIGMENATTTTTEKTKFCKHCGSKIAEAAVICPHCGCQVENMNQPTQPNIVINNANTNTNNNVNAAMLGVRIKNKWVAFFLCLFLGFIGAHKFYEGKIGAGILYLFTGGIFGIGWLIDCIILLFKPNPYYVR